MTSSEPKHLPAAPPPNTITLQARASTQGFGECKQSIAGAVTGIARMMEAGDRGCWARGSYFSDTRVTCRAEEHTDPLPSGRMEVSGLLRPPSPQCTLHCLCCSE